MNRRTLTGISVALGIIVILIALWFFTRPQQGIPRVGAILPLTGSAASFGQASKNSLLLASDEINGVSGGPILKLLIEDDMTTVNGAVSAFNRLYDLDHVRLFTTFVSGISLSLAPLADKKGALLFANASAPQVTQGRKLVLRYSNTADEEAQVLFDFISRQTPSWSRLYVVAQNDDYGQAYVQALKSSIARFPNMALIGVDFYDLTINDFRTLAAKTTANNPDAVIIIGFGNAVGLYIRQLRESGFTGHFVASLGFILTTDAITTAGDAARGGYFINFSFVKESGARDFRQKYIARYSSDPAPNAVIDYGTLWLLAQGLRAVGPDPTKLSAYFRSLGTTHLPTGDVSITPQGDILAPVYVQQIPATGPISLWGD
jgi:branched-chain amino acid transport system substrate-binding protein